MICALLVVVELYVICDLPVVVELDTGKIGTCPTCDLRVVVQVKLETKTKNQNMSYFSFVVDTSWRTSTSQSKRVQFVEDTFPVCHSRIAVNVEIDIKACPR